MYEIVVFYPDDPIPRQRQAVARASDALTMISTLLDDHRECERVSVIAGGAHLFSVDCHGNRLHRTRP